VQRRFDEMSIAVGVHQLEQHVVADRTGHIEGLDGRTALHAEVPTLRDHLAVGVADHLEECSADQFVHGAAGQHRCALVGGFDDPALVQPHHGVGEIVEESADLGLGPLQFVDRAPEPTPDPVGLPDRGHHGRQREQRGHGHDGDILWPGVAVGAQCRQHDECDREGDDRNDQPPTAERPLDWR
jgi:hypothetical protein